MFDNKMSKELTTKQALTNVLYCCEKIKSDHNHHLNTGTTLFFTSVWYKFYLKIHRNLFPNKYLLFDVNGNKSGSNTGWWQLTN